MMTNLIIPLLVSVIMTPVKPVQSSDSNFSSFIDLDTSKSEEESKQVINNKNEVNLTSIIDNIYKLSNNSSRRSLKENYQTYRSFKIKKNKHPTPLYDSRIFYVRLPPAPYFYVPGLGYISNQPQFSTTSVRPYKHNKQNHNKINSLINLPINFISNGKPSSVYQWEKPLIAKRESPIIKLKEGPYQFNGKPSALYLFGPTGQTSLKSIKHPHESISQSN